MYYLTYLKPATFDPSKGFESYNNLPAALATRRLTVEITNPKMNNYTFTCLPDDIKTKVDTVSIEYTTFRIPKRSGGYREIKAPSDDLKYLQKLVYKYLSKDLHVLEHNCAFGFVHGRSTKASLEVHQRAKSNWFMKLDFHNFFPSFTKELIITKLSMLAQFRYATPQALEQLTHIATDENDKMVQGSPLSPYLANLCMMQFDNELLKICKDKRIVYTRYADDILLSSKYKANLEGMNFVITTLLNRLCYTGFTLSEAKTRLGNCSGRNWNLGIMYNQEKNLTVGYRNKHIMKVILHKWDSLSATEQQHWSGVLAYYKAIEPEYFNKLTQ